MLRLSSVLSLSFASALVIGASLSGLQADAPADPPAGAPAAAGGAQLFDTPEAAMKALVAALKANDDAALKTMAGADSDDVIQSGKDPIVARERKRVATMADEKIEFEDLDDGTKVAVLGLKEWPMPLPLAPKDGKWFFDVEQGRDEMLARRIGANELRVIDAMRTLVEAQTAYMAQDRDGDGVLEYAQKFVSTPGTKDGLFWIDEEGVSEEERSPLGAMVDDLGEYSKGTARGDPYSGYLFKLLTAQGCSAPGGVQSYLTGENLTGGWAVLAVPAKHRDSGVKSFIISHRGRLFERDLGPKGPEVAKTISTFEPDTTWVRLGNP